MPDVDELPDASPSATAKPKRKPSRKKPKRRAGAARAAKPAPSPPSEPTAARAAKLAANLITFEKTTFENAAKLLASINDQSERAIRGVLSNASWVPKEGQEFIREWQRTLRNSLKDFTKTVDKSFDLMSRYVERMQSESTEKK